MMNLEMNKQNKNIEAIYELSPMQQGMLFHTIYNSASGDYLEQLSATLITDINISAFKKAWEEVVERHSVLRTSFVYKKLSKMLQVVHKRVELPFIFEDWTEKSNDIQEKKIKEFLINDRKKGFNLNKAPLLRISLIKLAESKYKLIWSHHHILIDGWSLPIILQELFTIYGGLLNNKKVELPYIRPYKDYIKYLQQQNVENANRFWAKYLDGFTEKTPLIIDNIPFYAEDKTYKKKTIKIDKDISQLLIEFARSNKLTINTLLQAGWALLLHKYSGNEDVLFGATFSGRPATLSGSESMVGLFINSLPIRALINPQSKIIDWIAEFNNSQTELREYESSALVDIQKVSKIPAKQNLFDSLFVFENYPVDESLNNSEQSIKFEDIHSVEQTNYPLTIVSGPGEEIHIDAAYDGEKIADFSIDLLLAHYKNILQYLVIYSDKKIKEIEYLTDDEKELLLPIKYGEHEIIQPRVLIKKFEKTVAKYPNNIAVKYENSSLTFDELNKQANKLARLLKGKNIGSEDLVAVYMNRSIDMIISILAILKTGAGYVPIDPSYPNNRVEYILSDSGCKIFLTESGLVKNINQSIEKYININEIGPKIESNSDKNLNVEIFPDNIAYVIYTSGSTGNPKGTLLQNKSVCNFIKDFSDSIGINEKSIVLQFASFGFDASIPEIFTPLLNGGTVQMISKDQINDLSSFADFIVKNKVTTILLPPSVLSILDYFDSPHLKTILSAGEACTWEIAEKWGNNYKFINGYGPTEATVGCSWGYYSSKMNTATVPIGKPIYNVKVYVLDNNLMPVPFGTPGELFVGEEALARGYLKNPALTASKFIPNPYSNVEGERIYSTRDSVRVLPDGQLEFIGRIDNQVKLRGFRIELGEIESVLRSTDGIDQAVVVLQERDEKKLVAFIVSKNSSKINLSEVKKQLNSKLPAYMIPSYIEVIDELLLTAHGKVDRKSLVNFEIKMKENDPLDQNIISATEDLLISIFRKVLKINNISIKDNFFDLGGHSLLATQLASRIREAFNIELPINKIFELETIHDLATEIDKMLKHDGSFQMTQIKKYNRKKDLELSFSQQRMWFLQKFDPENIANNIFTSFILKGKLNVKVFKKSLDNILQRHEILRTYYYEKEGRPFQKIDLKFEYELPISDLSEVDNSDIEEKIKELAQSEASKVFNLSKLPLFSMLLVKIKDDEYVFMITMHHIISDGWSMSIMIKELAHLYRAQVENEETTLPELNIQYADFAQWQREWLSGENLEKQFGYWENELSEISEKIDIPTDKPRPSVQTFNGDNLSFELSNEMSKKFIDFAKSLNFTPYMVSLAAFNILLHKYANQNTIIVGSPIANRNRKEIENLIGIFVNTLVLRTDFNSGDKVTDILKQVREKTLKAYLNQDLPFEHLVDKLSPDRDMSHSPIFQVAFVFQNTPHDKLELPGIEIKPVKYGNKISKYDLTLYLRINDDKLFGTFEYNTDLFESETIYRMKEHFINILQSVVSNAKQKVSRLSLLSSKELEERIRNWKTKNRTVIEQKNLPQAFYKIAQRNSSEIAVTFSEFDKDTLFTDEISYKELNDKSNQLARYLLKLGLQSEDLVGVSTHRSLDLIIAILGIVKAGGAFIPIDPNYPTERIEYMISDSDMNYLITQEQLKPNIEDFNGKIILIDSERDLIENENIDNILVDIDPENLAYAIYTSGSTGNPKGTLLNHRGLINLAYTQQKAFNITNRSKVLQFSSLSFDAFVWETVMALLNGASLNLVTKEIISSAMDLVKVLKALEITTVTLPPSVLNVIPEKYSDELKELKTIIVAGEKCTSDLAIKWNKTRQFVNAYGPTETTVCASMFNCPESCSVNPPIGKEINNFTLYVLDPELNPVPIGIPGELYISGLGLARGYHNQPSLTASKFIPNPFTNIPGERMYKSGDLVKLLPSGDIDFIGRIDNQVKLRGFRIELGEIESVISSHPKIKNAIVMLREDSPGIKQLAAYIILLEKDSLDLGELRTFIRAKLPEYMVPVSYVILDEYPLTPSKKIDYKSLPIPEAKHKTLKSEYVAPRNDIEKKLAEIISNLLNVKKVGIYDNFFDLGGHSLLATQFISRVKEVFNKDIELRSLFEKPTIAELSVIINNLEIDNEEVKILQEERSEKSIEDLVNEIQELSDDGIEKLLNDEGKQLKGDQRFD